MKRYGREELVAFLHRMDAHLEVSADIIVIGGAAAMLAYGAVGPTKDIDTWQDVPASVLEAYRRVVAEAGEEVPVSKAGVADMPYDAEDRLIQVDLGLKRLRVWVPERHDLALSKIIRAYEHDLDTVEQMHSADPFDEQTIFQRFETEMKHVVADQAKLRLNFALLIERLYGPERAQQVAANLDVPAPHATKRKDGP